MSAQRRSFNEKERAGKKDNITAEVTLLRKGRVSLRLRPITFGNVLLPRRSGWLPSTMKSSRRFFKRKTALMDMRKGAATASVP
jgi:hypothetical protein